MSASATPPRLAERFLQRCLRSTPSARYIVGDLRQEYAALRDRRGPMLARLWYLREVADVGARYVGRGGEGAEPHLTSPGNGRGDPPLWRELWGHLVSALRVFRVSPGFAAAVVLTLGLGLGANATMFGAVDRILLSPPDHIQDHDDLRFLDLTGLGQRSISSPKAYSFPDYEAIRELPVLDGAAAFGSRRGLTMGSGADARRAIVQHATANFFPLLGVLPGQGRFFDVQDDQPGAPPVAVLSHGFWDQEFGRDPGVIGETVTLGSHSYEVIGVTPQGFTGAELSGTDVWVPLRMNIALTTSWGVLESRGAWWFRVVARLADGVTDEEAEAQMSAAHTSAVAAFVDGGGEAGRNAVGASVRVASIMPALGPNASQNSSITLWLAGVSLLVLLIACANVANLMLARGIDRQRERAVRLALGVSRRRLISQALAEALVLAVAGGIAAILVASWSGRALYDLLLPGVSSPEQVVDLRLVAFLGIIVLATTVVAGTLPALQALRTVPGDVLRSARRGSTRGGNRVRTFLTLGQVSLSTILLVGAGLFVQSLQNAFDVDVGFDYEPLINVELEGADGVDLARRDALHRQALEVLQSIPGVEGVTLSSSQRPLYGWDEQSRMTPSRMDSLAPPPGGGPFTYAGTEGYVETAGLRVTRGRAFEPSDYAMGAPFALMVSRSFAEGAWPGLDPLQECITLTGGATELDGPEPCRPVVGVYEDLMVRSLGESGIWSVTWPMPLEAEGLRGILVRAGGDPTELARAIRDRLTALSSDIRYVRVIPMASRIEAMRGPWRVGATLFTIFGVLALLVASLGLYSVLSFAVARRSREIGIRSALGAQRRDLVTMVVVRAARLVGAGLIFGLIVAVLTGRFMESVLFGVPTLNPLVFGLVALVLVTAGLLAAWVPALKATAIDPAGAMTAE